MANGKVNFAVIGCSPMGEWHMQAIATHTKMNLVALCDKDAVRLQECAERFDVAAAYTDYREMLKNEDVEAVVVCTPDFVHEEMTEAALKAGKHVMCEKPMALTMEECERMCTFEEKYGKKLMVGQICRYTHAFKLTKELIDKGEIGELYYVESEYAHDYFYSRGADDWRADPNHPREPYIGGGCHAVDLLRWIAGDPTEVTAYSNHKCLTGWPVNDATVSILKFPNDVIGKVFVSIGCKRDYTMRSVFYGTKGTIICDNTSSTMMIYKTGMEKNEDIFTRVAPYGSELSPISLSVTVGNHNSYGELEDFINAILEDKPTPTTAYDGASTVAVCLAAVESAKIGAPVKVKYPKK
jgi:predicted dehydrogenase